MDPHAALVPRGQGRGGDDAQPRAVPPTGRDQRHPMAAPRLHREPGQQSRGLHFLHFHLLALPGALQRAAHVPQRAADSVQGARQRVVQAERVLLGQELRRGAAAAHIPHAVPDYFVLDGRRARRCGRLLRLRGLPGHRRAHRRVHRLLDRHGLLQHARGAGRRVGHHAHPDASGRLLHPQHSVVDFVAEVPLALQVCERRRLGAGL
mmetsp:Transcript_1791/g.7162  ORF Transcript_1791/g.7162 Transcript_1791/m.7162 type:complete len:207 (+) Transcript_1791:1677-2297(+)